MSNQRQSAAFPAHGLGRPWRPLRRGRQAPFAAILLPAAWRNLPNLMSSCIVRAKARRALHHRPPPPRRRPLRSPPPQMRASTSPARCLSPARPPAPAAVGATCSRPSRGGGLAHLAWASVTTLPVLRRAQYRIPPRTHSACLPKGSRVFPSWPIQNTTCTSWPWPPLPAFAAPKDM